MLAIGLTGGIGSGKTAASDHFARLGAPVIDADLLARELVEPGQPALQEITARFGLECIDADGRLRRDVLRQRVFADPSSREQLENILHPRIRALLQERIAVLTAPYGVVVIPLLVEIGMQDLVDRVLVVDAPESEQIRRLQARDGIDEAQARQMLTAQASRSQRLALADDIVENTGDLAALEAQISALHQRYLALAMATTDRASCP